MRELRDRSRHAYPTDTGIKEWMHGCMHPSQSPEEWEAGREKNRRARWHLSSLMTAVAWALVWAEDRKVAGTLCWRTSAISWSWMRERRGETTMVTPGERTAGSWREGGEGEENQYSVTPTDSHKEWIHREQR